MKKSLFIIAIAASLAATGCAAGYVDQQPGDVTYEQGTAPGPDYGVWIDGDWIWGGRKILLAQKRSLGIIAAKAIPGQKAIGPIPHAAITGTEVIGNRETEIKRWSPMLPFLYHRLPKRHQRQLHQLQMLSRRQDTPMIVMASSNAKTTCTNAV